MSLRHLILSSFALLVSIVVAIPADAGSPIYNSDSGTAVRGFDVVAYFTQDLAVPGNPDHAVMWKGAVWRFVSTENRETFEANPRAYAPQYGGYCAFALAQGHIEKADPEAWQIHDGKLYLIHNHAVREIWTRDIPGHVIQANTYWPHILRD